MATKVPFSRLTAKQAKTWLIQNDAEEAAFWSSVKSKKDLVDSVGDNLAHFGIKEQSGDVIITSNQECFQAEFIRQYHNTYR
ncbi:MAG: hypothetical protein JKY54_14345 [Flavobacteriales bacterium]|nr:hypothetical protein [Flavobacteriales bacterium]